MPNRISRCQFVPTLAAGVYRCRQCGFETAPVRQAGARIHRVCDVIADPANPPPDDTTGSPPDSAAPPGLGDAIAAWAEPIARWLGWKDCAPCARRRRWLNRRFPYRPRANDARPSNPSPNPALPPDLFARHPEAQPFSLLLRFPHGFGDAVQLTTVLAHLRQLKPHWAVDVAVGRGAESLLEGQCRQVWSLDDPRLREPSRQHDLDRVLRWSEPVECYADSPATKAERCLREVFHITPQPAWCRYTVHPQHDARRRAGEYARQLERPFALVHYQGNSSRLHKNLDERVVARLCRDLISQGLAVVVLDWDRRSRLVDGRHILGPGADHPLWNGRGTGDGGTLAALAARAKICIGIDSGPGHVFGATPTPTLMVWTKHHPLHYYGLADHVLHLVPADHPRWLRGQNAGAGEAYFARHYRHRRYRNLETTLVRAARERLAAPGTRGLRVDGDLWVRREHHQPDLTIVRDVYLEDCYRLAELPFRPRTVVDIGAHLGAFAAAVRQRSRRARIVCVEAHPDNVPLLQANVGAFAEVVAAAVTSDKGPAWLQSTIHSGSTNTGGSWLWQGRGSPPRGSIPVPAITFDALLAQHGFRSVDLLKLDCEGCELSLLRHSDLSRVRHIVGEYHDRRAFLQLLAERLPDWKLHIIRDGEPGLFWLLAPTPSAGMFRPHRPNCRSARQRGRA